MKLNWGSGIAIFYLCFMAIMIFMVIKSKQNTVHMVQDNYYQKDLAYEKFRKSRENATLLKSEVALQYQSEAGILEVTFPERMRSLVGTITFFRPSDSNMDQVFKLKLDEEDKMLIPIDDSFPKGRWRIQLDWENDGLQFYKEETIVI